MTTRSIGTTFIATALLATLPAVTFAQRPNRTVTPGAKGKANETQICAADYESTVKPMAGWQRSEALSRYGKRVNDEAIEVDHLIPLSIGGTNDPDNLWPIPDNKEYGVAAKRELDSKLRQMVCDKTLPLKTAQDAVRKDWVKAYDEYVKGTVSTK
jgi:hypothetical protein